ncbi:MAG: radical SAM protein [Dehalococcoidia bacterium]|nr:radical SAM protein [Dehalococcoidia bacterium]
MDILLTHGYFLSEDPLESAVMKPYPPLGILYLSSHLKARGLAVGLFDSTFSSRESFAGLLVRERPAVIGIYGNLLTRASVLRMIHIGLEYGATVVLGGPEPANYADKYLGYGADVVVIGEGEITLEELLPALAVRGPHGLHNIKGIVFRDDDGALVRTGPRPFISDLDAQPFPDRSAIELAPYLNVWRERHGMTSISLSTARGCPYSCAWCSHAVFGTSHRRRSPQNVADEVQQIAHTYRPDMLWFADDVFTIQPRWLLAYAAELERRGLRVPFEATAREDSLNEEVICTLAAMGCFRLWIGAESGSQRLLDAMQRRTDARRLPDLVRLAEKHGIATGLFVMLGYEGEDMSDIKATAALLKAANPSTFLRSLAYPVRGTPYYEHVADRVIAPKPWSECTDRDLTVAGRHSRRFYSFVDRWMVGEVAWHKQRRSSPPDFKKLARAFADARIGRLGMFLSQREVESG